jgi:hypothetical protein
MMQKTSIALVASSSDPRYQEFIHQWLDRKKLYGNHIRVAIRGSVKDRETIMKHVRAAHSAYRLTEVHLMNVEDDPAYEDRKFANRSIEKEAHVNDLNNTRAAINAELPKLKVFLYYIDRKGTIEKIS